MPDRRSCRLATILIVVLVSACSNASSPNNSNVGVNQNQAAVGALPAIESLEAASGQRHRVSATSFELLDSPPSQASLGAAWTPGSLNLDFAMDAPSPAWGVFALPGLPGDGTIVPTSLDVSKDLFGWVALANYSSNSWEITQLFSSGTITIDNGIDYISPSGNFFAAVIAFPFGPNPSGVIQVNSLLAHVSADLPAGPTAVLDILTGNPENTVPVQFSHQNSLPGDGSFTSFTYDFGDASGEYSTSDPMELVTHAFTDPGTYTVTLTVVADVAGTPRTSFDQAELDVALVGAPVAALRVVGTRHAVKFPVRMDAVLSDPGLGTWTSIAYDFGDSNTYTAANTAEVVEHEYAMPGTYTITLTVATDQGGIPRQDTDSTDANVADTVKEVLVVYNSDIPESDDLRAYYCIPETGRGIDPDYQLGIALGGDGNQVLDRATYNTNIRDTIKTFIDFRGFKDSLKYILLCKGVPHKIDGINGGDYTLSTYSAVDSELCTLYSDGTYPYESFLWNESSWQSFGGANDSFYMGLNGLPLSRDYNFAHAAYNVSDSLGNEYPLDYLVGRLSGYTYDDAKALVDRAIAAESTSASAGWVIMDTTPSRTMYDTMADPVWPDTANTWDCGSEVLTSVGQNNYIDLTTLRLTGQASDVLPIGSVDNVVAYAGWGVNHTGGSYANGANYILLDLLFTYLPGAAWISYESFNGTTFYCSNPADPTVGHPGQGQICDFIRKGGSCAIGNCWEPWTLAVGDERVIQYRYVVERDRWIEAAYKGMRCLSWMEVVVGDPLCQLAP